jgi:hypothetical protein
MFEEGGKMNFFTLLKKKLTQDPAYKLDRNFDQQFWKRFNAEFGEPSKPFVRAVISRVSMVIESALRARSISWIVPALATLSILFTASFSQYQKHRIEADILQHEQLVDHLDLFLTFDDVSQLKDSDWNTLLHKKTGDDIDDQDNEGSDDEESET